MKTDDTIVKKPQIGRREKKFPPGYFGFFFAIVPSILNILSPDLLGKLPLGTIRLNPASFAPQGQKLELLDGIEMSGILVNKGIYMKSPSGRVTNIFEKHPRNQSSDHSNCSASFRNANAVYLKGFE